MHLALPVAFALGGLSIPAMASPPPATAVIQPTSPTTPTMLVIHGRSVSVVSATPADDDRMRVIHGAEVAHVPTQPTGGPQLRMIHGSNVQDRQVDARGCLRDELPGRCLAPAPSTSTPDAAK